jgi:RNA polymerase sigma factor
MMGLKIMRELDQRVLKAAKNEQELNSLIKEYEFFILKSASKTAKQYVSKTDDEWSIALSAFSEAIQKYSFEKGSFISFAELMINRRLIDYFRAQRKFVVEDQVDWIEDNAIIENDDNLKLEIEAISQVLEYYGFSFMDLAECSPKAQKTKTACAKAVVYLLEKPMLITEIRNSKQLPIKLIAKNVGLPRKIIERHRKYIIAAVEILYGDYPYISEYLSFVREAVKR